MFVCETCTRSFQRKDHLQRHLQSHKTPGFVCSVCSEAFVCRDILQRHALFHFNAGNPLAPRKRRVNALIYPPSADEYLELYLKYYDPHLPILHHTRTFSRVQQDPPLFRSVLAIGAFLAEDRDVASSI